jgi:hypothetical protein
VRFKRESISWMMSLGAVGEERGCSGRWGGVGVRGFW